MAASPDLRIVERAGTHHVELSPPIRAAILRYDRTFRVRSDADYLPLIRQYFTYSQYQAPFAVIGDFNADGALDVVLDGRTDTSAVILAVLSSQHDQAYEAIEVETEVGTPTPRRSTFLRRRIDPGRVTSQFVPDVAILRGHGFEIEYWEKAAILYYWKDGTFHELVVAD